MIELPRLAELGADTAHLREEEVEPHVVWKSGFLELRKDRMRSPGGGEATREFVVHPGAVMVVPLLDDGRVVIERQWRYPLGRAVIEFPAGKLEAGEPVLDCAVRELLEETGLSAREWARAGLTHNAIAYSTEGIEVWFARGLTGGARRLDDGEFLDVAVATFDELDALARSGELTDAKTLVGLLWWANVRAGRWPLVWQAAPG